MQRLIHCLVAALTLPVLIACGTQGEDTSPADAAAAERIIAKETSSPRQPDQRRGIEIRRIGFQSIFADTAMQYDVTVKQDNLIDVALSAHRLEGQQLLKSSARMQNLPLAEGDVTIDAGKGDDAPGMILTGVPGFEDVSMRMNQGSLAIVSLPFEKDTLTGLPVIDSYEITFKGRFLAFSEDPDKIVVDPVENRGVTISGAVRYHKD